MTNEMLAPFMTLVGIAIPVGVAVLVIGISVTIGPRLIGLLRQRAYDRATEGERVRWVLRLDPAAAADRDAAVRLIAALHPGGRRGVSAWASGWPTLELLVRWADGRAHFELVAPRQLARSIETAVAAAYPAAELEPLEPDDPASRTMALAVGGEPPEAGTPGPTAGFGAVLVELLARLPRDATGLWRLRVSPLPEGATRSADDVQGMSEMFFDSFLGRPPRPLPSAAARSRAPRQTAPAFSVSATLEVGSADLGAARAWLFDALAAVGTLRAAGWRIEARIGGRPGPMRLVARDLAELWGVGGAASESRPVDAIRSRRLPSPILAAGPGLRAIGVDAGRPVLLPEDVFGRHVVLLGRTGSGKSTELVALAADDLRAGRGFTFIDPHGDAVARLLDAVPPEATHRVHLLELAEKEHPRGFNPIELDGADPEMVAAQFVDTMRDLYFAMLSSPPHRQLQYLRQGLLTLLTTPVGDAGPWTLESLVRLFTDRRFRDELLAGVTDPMVRHFWEHEWPTGRRGASDPSADALISKLSAFLSYPSIRAIVSAPRSTIRPRTIMDAGEVLLVDLSRAGGDNAWLFGGLVIARTYVDALGRQSLAPAARVPHTLYVDEVQNFDTSALREIPAAGRKFALRLVMATQYLDALGRELQRSIRANVATTMLLQPSADDARLLRDAFAPLTERDLVNLPRFAMAVRTELDGDARILTANVLPEPPDLGSAALVRRLSDRRDERARSR